MGTRRHATPPGPSRASRSSVRRGPHHDDQGEAPWDDKSTGELEVRGPWVAASYYDGDYPASVGPEERAKWTAHGWFRTGDVASIDPLGYMKICDRTKDLIKSGGEWISSVDPKTPSWDTRRCARLVSSPCPIRSGSNDRSPFLF